MVEPESVRSLRIAGATSLEIYFSTGQTLAMHLHQGSVSAQTPRSSTI